ncbi:MAG: hypothetical protein AAFV45_01785 [Pseudomonadota bacterium]
MAEERSLSYSIVAGLVSTAVAIVTSALLVIVELMAALLTYFYLANYDRELFGALVGYAKSALDFCVGQLEYWVPSISNAANATLVGELSAKAMLLLIIGLVVGAFIRIVLWMVGRLFGYR